MTITLASPGTVGGNQTTVTDDRGGYQFIRLVPPSAVRAELQGFRTVVREKIVVNADVTARVDPISGGGQRFRNVDGDRRRAPGRYHVGVEPDGPRQHDDCRRCRPEPTSGALRAWCLA